MEGYKNCLSESRRLVFVFFVVSMSALTSDSFPQTSHWPDEQFYDDFHRAVRENVDRENVRVRTGACDGWFWRVFGSEERNRWCRVLC